MSALHVQYAWKSIAQSQIQQTPSVVGLICAKSITRRVLSLRAMDGAINERSNNRIVG